MNEIHAYTLAGLLAVPNNNLALPGYKPMFPELGDPQFIFRAAKFEFLVSADDAALKRLLTWAYFMRQNGFNLMPYPEVYFEIHNMIAEPLSDIVYVAKKVHNVTIPNTDPTKPAREHPGESIIITNYIHMAGDYGRSPWEFIIYPGGLGWNCADRGQWIEQHDGPAANPAISEIEFMYRGFMRSLAAIHQRGALQHHPVSDKENRQRKREGKPPKFSYTQVDLPKAAALVPPAGPSGKPHASPRWHTRRGHLRRLRSGKVIEIAACEVGDKARGVALHDYDVTIRPPRP